MAIADYLKLRGRTWYVRVQVPPHLSAAAGGKREFVKTLKTGDLNEANRLKHAYVAAFKRQIAALGRHKPNPLAELYDKALAWRDAMERHKGEVLVYEGGDREKPHYATDEFLEQIGDEAREFLETHGEKAATSFYKIAKGEGTPPRNLIDTWLAEQAGTVTGQTCSQHRSVLNAFIEWGGEGVLIEDVNRRKAGEYVMHLLTPSSGLTRKTAQRYVSSLSSMWAWLIARGVVEGNPWLGHGVGKKSKRGETAKRRQWSDDALIKVLNGKHTPRYTAILHDLVRLAMVTGARLDELCALKTSDVQKRQDGWWITIREGKTEAAVREVPVHDSAAHVLIRRCKTSHDFVFDGLVPGGPDNKRSWNASKAFGLYTRNLGLGEERQVFHALRNTFIEAMEAAEVPESTTKLIIGHARQSLTYGHYSKGARVTVRESINKLHYASGVMRLIRAATDNKQKQQSQSRKKPGAPNAHLKSRKRRIRET
jgi:integrase